MTIFQTIRSVIETELEKGNDKFIIYPFGEMGMYTKQVLNEGFGIEEAYIIDNNLCKVNNRIKSTEFLKEEVEMDEFIILFTVLNPEIKKVLKEELLTYCKEENVVEIFTINEPEVEKTKCGKYSYGPLCNHSFVKEVGAFTSIAYGVDVAPNHAMDCISTHPFMYNDEEFYNMYLKCGNYEDEPWYFSGLLETGKKIKPNRVTIGNDVWIGRNVTITNEANIGNGVIIGAGAVVTKDIPDYAVAVGVPARVIRYRYTEEQIKKLNRIAWWNWSDEKIRECYDDFFLDIEEFLSKHYEE